MDKKRTLENMIEATERIEMERRLHRLKDHPEYFQQTLDGCKPWEFRVNDRDFQPGDMLLLEEYIPDSKEYTGRWIEERVLSVNVGGVIPAGHVIMTVEVKGWGVNW